MTKTVTQAYLLGIRDEREFFSSLPPAERIADASLYLDNIERTLNEGFSGDMAEYMRGSRDFWRNQIRKHSA
jgi:hypothetical protein